MSTDDESLVDRLIEINEELEYKLAVAGEGTGKYNPATAGFREDLFAWDYISNTPVGVKLNYKEFVSHKKASISIIGLNILIEINLPDNVRVCERQLYERIK